MLLQYNTAKAFGISCTYAQTPTHHVPSSSLANLAFRKKIPICTTGQYSKKKRDEANTILFVCLTNWGKTYIEFPEPEVGLYTILESCCYY